ncbi:MAG: pyridoxal phosphate-dependent aminotransferase [Cyclobacteriaceae bacterium]|nr:pyridoxal phosphate-dependent aminotransferase [Cyclobacteriaceae bacterium]
MRQQLLTDGAHKIDYEIRDIVKKATQLEKIGKTIYWENIGDPIVKNCQIPSWLKDIVSNLAQENKSYGYSHSKGEPETRAFLAHLNNSYGGAKLSEEDLLFFNGLGDAIGKIYQFLNPFSRIIGPSPAYSTHSSLEAAHSNKEPLTYSLDPENNWYPDLEDLYLKVKYNPNIVGILIINPDNPTGMVYPKEYMTRIVSIAKEFDLFIISDEIYGNIIYNQASTFRLSEVIGDTPGIALKGISKELPWPGSRCGWMEFYNRGNDLQFDEYCTTLENAKMVEVCSTTLPQKSIPLIMGHPNYKEYISNRNKNISERSTVIASYFENNPYIYFNKTNGAFYNTIVFKNSALKEAQSLPVTDPKAKQILEEWISDDIALDKRFAYSLLASTGICVTPLSSFQSDLMGFRITLLEEDEEMLHYIFKNISEAITTYCTSTTTNPE